jgi:hypothetical protein
VASDPTDVSGAPKHIRVEAHQRLA